MVYGLISDVHGNLDALEAALAELRGVDAFLCLGDIVGYGPDPGPCVDRVSGLPGLVCLAGNHDLAAVGDYDLSWFNAHARVAAEWTAGQLSPDQKAFLRSLRPVGEAGGAALAHGSLAEPMAYITSPREAMACFEAMPGRLCFIGHTHIAEHYRNRVGTMFCDQNPLWGGGAVEVGPADLTGDEGEAQLRHIVNPGAVGQPRDGNPMAAFAVWDTEAGVVEVKRTAYDIGAVQEKMRQAELPHYLAERLAVGR